MFIFKTHIILRPFYVLLFNTFRIIESLFKLFFYSIFFSFPIENCIPNSNLSVNFLVDSDQYMSQENQSRECVGKKCHNLVPGNQPEWSEWSFWSVCSGICGNSKQSRVRECGSNDNAVNHTVTCLGRFVCFTFNTPPPKRAYSK